MTTIRSTLLFVLFPFALALPWARAQSARNGNPVFIDASAPSTFPEPSSYHGGSSASPSGQTIGVNSMYLTLNGKPWLPVMGEFHFTRVPEDEWDEEILKMKAAGVSIVSTYVFWIHHEEIEGQFDWSGNRDLRRFVELCSRHGMKVLVRIGPWDHGEARNGGLPDWILKKGPTRENDPVFMDYVAKLYGQIGQQLQGLLWKDGGPVIGIQLENEFAGRGPKQGDEYLLALKNLAMRSGLDVPLYTITGWDNAVIPQGEVLPVFGGYPDAPWDDARGQLPPSEVYVFRFHSHISGNMGMLGGQPSPRSSEADAPGTPFMTAEMGGGVQDTYHRRPVIEPDDVAAMMPVMLGSGVNLYGTYMFQGGENPDGKRTTLQESHATGYPNDVPVKSYDFQAPLGEFGQERESFRKLKVLDYFLDDFGSELAVMSPHPPRAQPKDPSDFSVIRAAVRSEGKRGFLFVNNYVRGYPVPARSATQFEIHLPGQTLTIPDRPITIPSGSYFLWPFNLNLGPALLQYSTAQLFTKLDRGAQPTWVFEEIPGIAAEFVFSNADSLSVAGTRAEIRRTGGKVIVTRIPAAFGTTLILRSGNGQTVSIMLLTQHEAENAWRVNLDGQPHLLETEQEYFADSDHIVLRSEGTPNTAFSIYPALDRPLRAAQSSPTPTHGPNESTYHLSVPEQHIDLHFDPTRRAAPVPAVRLSPPLSWEPNGVAMAPPDSEFDKAAQWNIAIPKDFLTGVSDVFLEVEYAGDVARLSSHGRLLDDDFYNGKPWGIGLRRFADPIRQGSLDLSILPLREDAPIYLDERFRPNFGGEAQIDELKSLRLVPEYQFVIPIESDDRARNLHAH